MHRLNRGFTLIEVLVVVSILGVLAGLISILVVRAAKAKEEFLTKEVRTAVDTAVHRFEQEFKKLPPMMMTELAQNPRWNGLSVAGNSTNECNECLLVGLHHPDFSAPLEDLALPLGNTDSDIWNKIPDGTGVPEAREICDAWSNPFIYITKNAYGQSVRIMRADGTEVEVHAVRKPSGDYYNATSFQIISLGRDGTQDEDWVDDIENFSREEQ